MSLEQSKRFFFLSPQLPSLHLVFLKKYANKRLIDIAVGKKLAQRTRKQNSQIPVTNF